jgi:hypothetical protein
MFTYDSWKPNARADAYTTPCGRYSVEQTGAERFEREAKGNRCPLQV